MAIPTLTDEQTQTWTRDQKDRWWLANVYRGDMLQLTVRSGVTGFLLGGILSATNLYVGAKTGWTLGVGITSVILAFAMFRLLSRLGMRDMTILENNAMQSIATAAGYMTVPLVSGFSAFMWIENRPISAWHMVGFLMILASLGVLVAFPLKRRFINDEQQPFPEGRACGVVLDTLYTSQAEVGMFKAKALALAAGAAGLLSFVMGESYMRLIQERFLGLKKPWHLPHNLDALYYWAAEKGWLPIPRLANVDIRQYGLSPGLDLAMFGAGALMGMRTAASLLIGMLVNFVFIAPWMISIGEIRPQAGSVAEGTAVFGRTYIVNNWSLWWGISIMIVASIVSLFAKPKVFVEAFQTLLQRGKKSKEAKQEDVLADIELPLWVSWVGVPVFGALSVWAAWAWFGVSPWLGALALPLIFVLALIAATSTALTSITPTGSLSKIPQFTFGAMDPLHPATNLMTGVMCVEVAGNASNLLMDIKPGYMLGAKPRQQAIGHFIGIIAGSLAAVPLFFALFLSDYREGMNLQSAMVPEGGQFTFPGAMQWKGVSDLVTSIFSGGGTTSLLTPSILTSMAIAAVVGLVFEVVRIVSKGRFPLSALSIGLGVVIPPDSTMAIFAGALFFWAMERVYGKKKESKGHLLFIDTQEPICAGIIAGAALVGIGDVLVRVFVLS